MLVGLCGGEATFLSLSSMRPANPAAGICAGKKSVAEYLVEHEGFSELFLARTTATPPVKTFDSQSRVSGFNHTPNETIADDKTFLTVEALINFVTKSWQQRWVTTDVWDEGVLEMLSRRPFFILVSVDAPVSIRWRRFKERYVSHGASGQLEC